jgi:2-desacetyl-2-hydroxyethyl bacteriochlorophyllide A dehydrogenase
MLRQCVVMAAPHCIEVVEEPLAIPQKGQVLVQSEVSAISAGTELLFYRGQAPGDIPVDATLGALGADAVRYPLRYGYACVGRIVDTAVDGDRKAIGRRVFAFHPHASHFWAEPAALLDVPAGLDAEKAAFLPNMETAVNLTMDGEPAIGERVAVVGQGVVGLLTLALLRLFPLEVLTAVDPLDARRSLALALGADAAIAAPPGGAPAGWEPADLVYELSGNPAALNTALSLAGYAGRVVIGSWYGSKQAPLDLGGAFHRSRIRLIASQVSTIAPQWSGRWDKSRRFALAWAMLGRIPVERLITHRFAIDDAAAAYRLIDEQPAAALQVLLSYPPTQTPTQNGR